MVKVNFYKVIFINVFILIILSLSSNALPRVYLNDSTQFTISVGSPNRTLTLSKNLTIDDNINNTFEAKSTAGGAFNFDVEYIASNTTGFLLRFRIDDEAGTASDIMQKVDCINTSDLALTTICDNGCGGNDFNVPHNYTVFFNSTSLTARIFIDSINRADVNICTNATQIGNVKYSRSQGSVDIQNNLLFADNLKPNFVGNLPNITWPEDNSTSFNISGNFSDPNNDTLTYNVLSPVENITIAINSSTGIVNLTPSLNFFGIRYVIFLANDSDNITLSNNVTLNITNVNDLPTVTNLMLNNTDFLNRTNGSLVVGWTFNDIDNDAQQGNETLWYVNGVENVSLKNTTTISAANTTKNQNYTFSVSVSDGTNFSVFVNSTSLIIQNSVPTHTIPVINSSDGQNRKNGTLTCNNQSTSDLDNDATTNFIRWYKNNALVDTAINLTNLSVGNYSKNDNVTCEITPNDGAVNGTPLNSTNFTVLNAASLVNNSIQNKTWDEDSSITISMVNGFVDIDGDNLTYNFTPVSNIAVSIDNNTGIATLTPEADFNGVRNVLFFAFDGTNLTISNNVTLTVNDVAEPSPQSSPSSGGGGGGGGGLPGYICDSKWECGSWDECRNGKQARECKLVKVPLFILEEKCPQDKAPEQNRNCAVPASSAKKEGCNDNIKNQNEEGVDCGGPCAPCFKVEAKKEEEKKETNQALFGPAVVAPPNKFDIKLWHIILIVFLIATVLIIKYKFLKKKAKKIGEYSKNRY